MNDLKYMEELLQEISNLTKGAQDKVVYLRDTEKQTVKSSPGRLAYAPPPVTDGFRNKLTHFCYYFYYYYYTDTYIQKSSSMLDDVLRFEKSIINQEEQI